LGLEVVGVHVDLARLEHDLDASLADVLILGSPYVICPWVPPERRSAEGYRALAHMLNLIGAACRTRGLQLCYHHHDFEFERFGALSGMEILLHETDPALLQVEIDVYWAAYAGVDPVALLRGLAGRVPLVHLKDMAADGSRAFAEVGHGVLDVESILAACDEVGVKWLVVEQDHCQRSPFESVAMSLAFLRSN